MVPIFFTEEAVNSNVYLDMLENYDFPSLKNVPASSYSKVVHIHIMVILWINCLMSISK
jgi:hypothetical protein